MRHSDERHAALREVTCERCAAVVWATKFSPQHTSVQWNADAAAKCAEFAEYAASRAGDGDHAGRAAPGARVPLRTCASLWATIDRAVREGRLEVKSP